MRTCARAQPEPRLDADARTNAATWATMSTKMMILSAGSTPDRCRLETLPIYASRGSAFRSRPGVCSCGCARPAQTPGRFSRQVKTSQVKSFSSLQFRGHAGYFPKVCVSSWRGLLLDVSRMCTCSVCVCASQLSPSLRVSVSLRRLSPPLLGASLESTFDRPRNRLTLLCISEIRITVRTFDFSSTLDAARPRHAYRVQAAAPEPVAQSAKPQTRFRLGSG